MGVERETGKQSKQGSDPRKMKSFRNARTPTLFSFKHRKQKSTVSGAPKEMSLQKSKSRPINEKTEKKVTGGSKRSTVRRKAKTISLKRFANGEIVDGVNQYQIQNLVKKSTKQLDYDVYAVKEAEQGDEYRMKVARYGLHVLKIEAALLRRLEKIPGDKCFVSMTEYGNLPKEKVEFLIVSVYGASLYDITKKILNGPFSIDCSLVVGLQMLRAIRNLHSLGYIHRNINPSAFNCGLSGEDMTVYLQDFRNVRKFEESKKHLPARPNVKFFGSHRFASRANESSKDQSRKDDMECWLYTLFYLVDPGSLGWKKENNQQVVLSMKEQFMIGEGKDQYARAPRDLAPILAAVAGYEFTSAPDYDLFKMVIENIQKTQNLNKRLCDWLGKIGTDEIGGDTNRSIDCQVTGERDVVVKGSRKKSRTRKKLSPGDIILGVGQEHGWKVISLLGSGGFGDVYKVHRENLPPSKAYALKTESEDGDKRYLRLKIEVTVMMKTAEKKKENEFKNFIEFIDRGKCEELKCKFVVMGLVGPSLEDIRRKYLLVAFSKHTSFNVAIQSVTAVRDLHSIGYLHRDIKPANFAVGLDEMESTVYMLDFGIAKLYVDENGDHKVKRKKVKFLGTIRYSSRACMMQQEQGRKDDLETWIYMVFDLMDEPNGMPWRKMHEPKEILKSKISFFNNFNSHYFTSNLKRLKDLVMYIDKMQYETTPDYEYILNFLKTTASDVNAKITKKLDWIGKLNKEEFDSDSERSDKKGSGEDDDE